MTAADLKNLVDQDPSRSVILTGEEIRVLGDLVQREYMNRSNFTYASAEQHRQQQKKWHTLIVKLDTALRNPPFVGNRRDDTVMPTVTLELPYGDANDLEHIAAIVAAYIDQTSLASSTYVVAHLRDLSTRINKAIIQALESKPT